MFSQTFTILDSHIEVQPGWLEPLMTRIRDDPTRVVMPQIDSYDQETMEPRLGGIGCSLGFLWTMVEHSIPIQKVGMMCEGNRREIRLGSICLPQKERGSMGHDLQQYLYLSNDLSTSPPFPFPFPFTFFFFFF